MFVLNSNAIKFLKNFSYTLSSNFVALLSSVLVVLIVPKLIGIEEYGYWQLYLFYSTYVGFMHFGWNDGIYLRYGGMEYRQLDRKLFFSQFYMLLLMQLMIAISISIVAILLFSDENRIFIIQMTAICLLVMNVRNMPLYILQATNRIKEYAQITMLGKILSLVLMISLLQIGVRDYKLLIIADLVGKFISLGYALYCCRNFVFHRVSTFYFSFRETLENVSVGIKLMFANVASLLIIGSVRFGIERSWDVATFGKVSLTLSLSNLMMLFINAIGIIMFPILRRSDVKSLPSIYLTMRDFLMLILLGALIMYYPLKISLSAWLPDYADSLVYMALLFPICIYEGKIALLINTYLKTLRKEKLMLKINLISLAFTLIVTFFTTIILKNLDLAVFSIVVLLAFRCILAEIYLSKYLDVSVRKDILLELSMTLIFVFSGWFINSWLSTIVYILAYFIYLCIKRKDISKTINNIKVLLKA